MSVAKKAFITGITGQDGSYLAELLLSKNYEVHGLIRRSSTFNTGRLDSIYKDPHENPNLILHYGDMADGSSLARLLTKIKPDEIYNLAAQSHVRVSFDTAEYTTDITATGVIRILEAIRETGLSPRFYQASSSEMFGKVLQVPQTEVTPFRPRSPYGCAKTFAYWATVNYREAYGLHISNGILFNHECITADTPVIVRKDGAVFIRRAGEVLDQEPTTSCRQWKPANLEIWDKNKWSAIKLITATWNNPSSDKRIHAVYCRGGYYEATADHISLLNGGNGLPVERKTGELCAGDKLSLGDFPDLPENEECSELLAEFFGMMAADGYASKRKARFTKNSDELRQRAIELWEILTGGEATQSAYPGGYPNSGLVKRADFTGRPDFCLYLQQRLYDKRGLKRVPKEVLNGSPSAKLAFLRGYNKCDGLKGGHQKTEFKSFTTDSPALALGLWLLSVKTLGVRITSHPEFRGRVYYHLNLNSPNSGNKGSHLIKPLNEIKSVESIQYTGWLYDFETGSGTFSAGVGLTWIHNSPRRGETFVTRKISRAVARIAAGLQDKLYLGNMGAERDWGYAPEYVEAMWLMLQQDKPDDYVIATNETHSVHEFMEEAFRYAGLDWVRHVETDKRYCRPTEVDILRGDYFKAERHLGWKPTTKFRELVHLMVDADRLELLKKPNPVAAPIM